MGLPLKTSATCALASLLIPSLLRMFRKTFRWTLLGRPVHDEYLLRLRPAVYPFWHRHLVIGSPYFYDRRVAVMISQSGDGEIVARALRTTPVRTIRGSSSRRGGEALAESVRWLREGGSFFFACDGPRGPRSHAKIGCVIAAQRSGVPIIPLGAAAERVWILKSWDRTHIPHPRAHVALAFGDPIWVASDADETRCETIRQFVQSELDRLEIECLRRLNRHPSPV